MMKILLCLLSILLAASFPFLSFDEVRAAYGTVKGAVQDAAGYTGPCGPVDFLADIELNPERYVLVKSYARWKYYVDRDSVWKEGEGIDYHLYDGTAITVADGKTAEPEDYRFRWNPAGPSLDFYDRGGLWISIPLYTEEKRAEIIRNEGMDQYMKFYHVTEYEIFRAFYREVEGKELEIQW